MPNWDRVRINARALNVIVQSRKATEWYEKTTVKWRIRERAKRSETKLLKETIDKLTLEHLYGAGDFNGLKLTDWEKWFISTTVDIYIAEMDERLLSSGALVDIYQEFADRHRCTVEEARAKLLGKLYGTDPHQELANKLGVTRREAKAATMAQRFGSARPIKDIFDEAVREINDGK